MKRLSTNSGLIVVSWALLLIFGCHKKKTPIPPEETPPTIISEMPIEKEPAQSTEGQNPSEQEAANNKEPEKTAPPRHPKHTPPRKIVVDDSEKPATTEEAKNSPPASTTPTPPRVVIQPSGSAPQDGANYQATTQQLLDGAENNLRNLKRQLSDNEQSMVAQIRDYIAQSKKATTDGDDVRAHNLALKARLLSDELVKGQ